MAESNFVMASGPFMATLRRHASPILWTLVAAGLVLRALLAYCSPTPFGYVFDYYHEAIELFYEKGRLPSPPTAGSAITRRCSTCSACRSTPSACGSPALATRRPSGACAR